MVHSEHNNSTMVLSDLAIGYYEHIPVVEHIESIVGHGEMIALVGRNGSGKSTLIKTLAGLLDPLSGGYSINDQSFDKLSVEQRAKTISYVSATDIQVPNLTVFELVSLGRYPYTNWLGGLSAYDREIIHSVLNWVSMTGYENKSFYQLSDGEKQRVMIARALAQDTPLILFDEPTAFLDLSNKFELIQLLDNLKRRNKTIIFSTHDLETAWLWADKFWVIHEKRLLDGSPEDLGLSGVYNHLFEGTDLYFNVESQRFEVEKPMIQKVYLKPGKDDAFRWTKRAFDRTGIKLVPKHETSIEVTIIEQDGKHFWKVRQFADVQLFNNLYNLVNYLILS